MSTVNDKNGHFYTSGGEPPIGIGACGRPPSTESLTVNAEARPYGLCRASAYAARYALGLRLPRRGGSLVPPVAVVILVGAAFRPAHCNARLNRLRSALKRDPTTQIPIASVEEAVRRKAAPTRHPATLTLDAKRVFVSSHGFAPSHSRRCVLPTHPARISPFVAQPFLFRCEQLSLCRTPDQLLCGSCRDDAPQPGRITFACGHPGFPAICCREAIIPEIPPPPGCRGIMARAVVPRFVE